MSRNINDIINNFDESVPQENQNIIILEWLQRHPGNRFDVMEVEAELSNDLEVSQKTVQNRLNELADDDILQTRGNQRIAYSLHDDIMIPIKYQAKASLRHLGSIFHVNRWGIAGWLVMSGAIWTVLTLPFLFFSVLLFASPDDTLGTIHQTQIFQVAVAMSLWLLVYVVSGVIIHTVNQRWGPFNIPWLSDTGTFRK